MVLMSLRRAVGIAALLTLPVAAQDSPVVVLPPRPEAIVAPGASAVAPPSVQAASCPPTGRPGLFNRRSRHAERKRHLQETFLGYPEEFNEWPLGQPLYAHGRTMVANGAAARLILNHYDFVGDTTELNYRGRDKLESIAAQLPASFAPVIIERTPWAPRVEQARRLAILSKLAEGPFPVPAERVVIGPGIAGGLRGREAILVDAYRPNLFAGGGVGGAAAGFDASGLSSSSGGSPTR